MYAGVTFTVRPFLVRRPVSKSSIRGEEILEQHLALWLDLHNLHHAVQHVVLDALDDGLRLFRVEILRLELRLYPCEDLGELPVLYADA